MTLRSSLLVAVLSGCSLSSAAPMAMAADNVAPSFAALEPGGFRTITQQLPINVVFVGYEPGTGAHEIDEQAFLARLPQAYCAQKRLPSYYGLRQPLGLCFNYEYNITFASPAFEDAFFGYLSGIAVPTSVTFWQQQYNAQPVRSSTVTHNRRIDAAAVEAWLGANGGTIGVDTTRYTVFFINWYGRPDFRFHVYNYVDEPDPDTGVNFGAFQSRAMIAWGGSQPAYRVWFYDLSAGPELWTRNYDITTADFNGNGVLDYRMPPVWEYGNANGYRAFDDLTGDLAKVARYVALNLLFTPSPLYDPAISPPELPSALQVDLNVFVDGGRDPAQFLNPDLIAARLGELQPLHQFTAEVTGFPLSGRIEDIYNCFAGTFGGDSCFGGRLFNIAFADLFLYFYEDHLLQYLEGDSDYEVPVFLFYSSLLDQVGVLGFADDNWRDGTQTYIMSASSDRSFNSGFGGTFTVTHEVGHHLGMSHPHDGYDYTADVDYSPGDAYFFAWSGDESRSIMSYLHTTSRFSRFDRDSMDRYLAITYINHANRILAQIVASPRVDEVGGELVSADGEAVQALDTYQSMDYTGSASHAKSAYDALLAAAASIQVQVEPQASQADYRAKGRSPKFVDTIDARQLAN